MQKSYLNFILMLQTKAKNIYIKNKNNQQKQKKRSVTFKCLTTERLVKTLLYSTADIKM